MGESAEMTTKLLFLDVCIKIEKLCAEIYHYLSEIHREYPEASRLWKKTALEEENHQKQFELARRIKDETNFTVDPADLSRAYVIHKKLINLLQIIKHKAPDLITAFSAALEMEEHIVQLHVQSALRYEDKSVQELFTALGEADQEHVTSLRKYMSVLLLPQSEMRG